MKNPGTKVFAMVRATNWKKKITQQRGWKPRKTAKEPMP